MLIKIYHLLMDGKLKNYISDKVSKYITNLKILWNILDVKTASNIYLENINIIVLRLQDQNYYTNQFDEFNNIILKNKNNIKILLGKDGIITNLLNNKINSIITNNNNKNILNTNELNFIKKYNLRQERYYIT